MTCTTTVGLTRKNTHSSPYTSLVADHWAGQHFCSVRFSAFARPVVPLFKWIAQIQPYLGSCLNFRHAAQIVRVGKRTPTFFLLEQSWTYSFHCQDLLHHELIHQPSHWDDDEDGCACRSSCMRLPSSHPLFLLTFSDKSYRLCSGSCFTSEATLRCA